MKLVLLLFAVLATTTLAENLRMIMWTFQIHGRGLDVPVVLETDYGYMLLNVGSMEEPKPHYILGNQKSGVIKHFKSKKKFIAALSQLEAGGELARYSRCLVPSDLGLKEVDLVEYEEIEKICKARKIKLSARVHMRCVCPDLEDSKR